MLQTLDLSAPFFALVLLGFVAVRQKLLPETAVTGLNAYVLYFALPCMLWRLGSNTPIRTIVDPVLLIVYVSSALILIALTWGLSRRWGLASGDCAMGALVAVFPNSGFLGLPLLISLLGSAASGPVMLTLWVDMVLTSSLCIALSGGMVGSVRTPSLLQQSVALAKNVFTNPLPWAIIVGAAASAQGWSLPQPIDSTLEMLARSASPTALFALGGVLAQVKVTQTAPQSDGVAGIALIKLLLHPLLVWATAQVVLQSGVPISPLSLETLVLVAALPSASNVVLLAFRQGARQERIAKIVMISTAWSFLSFSLIKAALDR